jgi:hypothetical protein
MAERTHVWRATARLEAAAGWRRQWETPDALILASGTVVVITPGTWLLDLGQGDYNGQPLYRLAGGQMVTLAEPLTPATAEIVDDWQVEAAMRAFQPLSEMVRQAFGLELDVVDHGLHPFQLVKCPLCHGTEFVTLDLASAWCRNCNARFTVEHTAGDPGFHLRCDWGQQSWQASHYLLPKWPELALVLTLKDSGDPLDMSWDPSCGRECEGEAVRVTGSDHVLRPGLHVCQVGTIYGWTLIGHVGSTRVNGEGGLYGDGRLWPGPELLAPPHVRQGTVCAIGATLPPVDALAAGEQYQLHRWWVQEQAGRRTMLHPGWRVVRKIEGDPFDTRYVTVRADLCPTCGRPVMPDEFQRRRVEPVEGDVHGFACRETWQMAGWRLAEAARTAV